MPGPQETRLIQALQGADPGSVGTRGLSWQISAQLLSTLAQQLATIKLEVPEGEAGWQTAQAMGEAFVRTAEGMAGRADKLSEGHGALQEASDALAAARATLAQLGGEQTRPTYTPPADPGSEEGIKQRQKHQADLAAYAAAAAEREELCRQAADQVDRVLQRSAATMRRIHGRTNDPGDSTPPIRRPRTPGGGAPGAPGSGGGGPRAELGTYPQVGLVQQPVGSGVPPAFPPGGPVPGPWVPGEPGSPQGGVPEPGAGVPAGTGGPAPIPGGAGGSGGAGSPAGSVALGAAGAGVGALGAGLASSAVGGARGGMAGVPTGGANSSGARSIGSTARSGASGTLGRGAAVNAGGASGRTGAAAGARGAGAGSGSRGGAGRGAAGGAGSRTAGGARSGAVRAATAGGGIGRGGRGGRVDEERGTGHEHFEVSEDWVGDDEAAPGVLD